MKTETLTNFQKDYFDFIVKHHKLIKKSDPNITQLNNLINWINKDYEVNYTMISHITGKVLTGDKKHSQMCLENMGRLEDILDW